MERKALLTESKLTPKESFVNFSESFRKIINGDYLPDDNDIQTTHSAEFLLENTFVNEPGSRSISTRRTTYPCLLE